MDIIFAGGSHHGIYGYLSLTNVFEKIYILEDSVPIIGDKKENVMRL